MQTVTLFALFVLALSFVAAEKIDDSAQAFEHFKAEYHKSYATPRDEARARSAFRHNVGEINKHNADADRGRHTFRLGVTINADMSRQQARDLPNESNYIQDGNAPAPPLQATAATFQATASSIDWRAQGWVTSVKNMGTSCKMTWAFASITTMEGQVMNVTGNLVSLSVQQLLDCTSFTCGGGNMQGSYQQVISSGGIDSDASYPYVGAKQSCRYSSSNSVGQLTSWGSVSPSESALQVAVSNIGPVAAAVNGNPYTFQHYSSGVYNDASCVNTTVSVAVAVVGYGTDPTAGPYWILKHCLGTSWGESGYMRLARNAWNMCGIANSVSYAIAKAGTFTTASTSTTTAGPSPGTCGWVC